MEKISIKIEGRKLHFDLANAMALAIAEDNEEEPMLICWNDRGRDMHSPSGVMCEIKGAPGWEVYGENHGGQLRISINDEEYVFIYA